MTRSSEIVNQVRFNGDGLVPAIAQDATSGDVLMLAWMDSDALTRTLETGMATYFSRSRQELWVKGESSGNRQTVREVAVDCDQDTILLKVDQLGPACHTGTRTCFTDRLVFEAGEIRFGDGVSRSRAGEPRARAGETRSRAGGKR